MVKREASDFNGHFNEGELDAISFLQGMVNRK